MLHECTSYFKKSVFERHLPEYTVHRVIQDDTCATSAEVMLSPHHLGWPMTRPRLYTVLIHKEKATLENFSVVMKSLFRRPHQKLGVHSLFVAPQDWTGLDLVKSQGRGQGRLESIISCISQVQVTVSVLMANASFDFSIFNFSFRSVRSGQVSR